MPQFPQSSVEVAAQFSVGAKQFDWSLGTHAPSKRSYAEGQFASGFSAFRNG
jgi:hypothetical protein